MDDIGKILTLALVVLTLATAAGFGLQRGRISDLNGRLKEADEELVRKDRRLTEAEAKVLKLETDLDALARVVTGEAHWTAIGEKLDLHHQEAETHWSRAERIALEIRDRLPEKSTS
jgi:hypothetical protein